jgi:stage V sporulation protein G
VQITEVRIKLMDESSQNGNERLHAFGSITFDDMFVVRDLKIIEGTKGLFVAMPSRKLTDRCRCGTKNPLRSRYCTNCGSQLDENRAIRGSDGRAKLHADIAHPINQGCREMIQGAVLEEYNAERERAKQPGYVSSYDEWEDAGEETDSYAHVISRLDAAVSGNGRGRTPHGPHRRSDSTVPSRAMPPSQSPSDSPKPFGAGVY